MLYTIFPALTLCMSFLNGSNKNEPVVDVAVDSDNLDDTFQYTSYLDAAMILLRAAKRKEIINKDNFSKETTKCPNRPIDCEELLLECGFAKSGIYHIWPRSRINTFGNNGFDVYCDMETDGGGWTIFQRRDDFGANSDSFYKNWLNYKHGFGHLNFDFWLGNDMIFALSNQRKSVLRIDLLDFADEEGYATYDNFYIDDEREGYKLHIGDYRGNIGDSFQGHNLCKFSTRDRDNDKSLTKHCARLYKGGWWYNDCHTANLNGLYLKGTHGSYADGINWYGWRGFKYSLKMTEMKLRSSTFHKHNHPKNSTSQQVINARFKKR